MELTTDQERWGKQPEGRWFESNPRYQDNKRHSFIRLCFLFSLIHT